MFLCLHDNIVYYMFPYNARLKLRGVKKKRKMKRNKIIKQYYHTNNKMRAVVFLLILWYQWYKATFWGMKQFKDKSKLRAKFKKMLMNNILQFLRRVKLCTTYVWRPTPAVHCYILFISSSLLVNDQEIN